MNTFALGVMIQYAPFRSSSQVTCSKSLKAPSSALSDPFLRKLTAYCPIRTVARRRIPLARIPDLVLPPKTLSISTLAEPHFYIQQESCRSAYIGP